MAYQAVLSFLLATAILGAVAQAQTFNALIQWNPKPLSVEPLRAEEYDSQLAIVGTKEGDTAAYGAYQAILNRGQGSNQIFGVEVQPSGQLGTSICNNFRRTRKSLPVLCLESSPSGAIKYAKSNPGSQGQTWTTRRTSDGVGLVAVDAWGNCLNGNMDYMTPVINAQKCDPEKPQPGSVWFMSDTVFKRGRSMDLFAPLSGAETTLIRPLTGGLTSAFFLRKGQLSRGTSGLPPRVGYRGPGAKIGDGVNAWGYPFLL